ncbi:MAG: tetratricopeptide repeat protein [Chloroflexi bacterium]|nr:tetratricopeptide repeat protein [Chloroflexota bacterium]
MAGNREIYERALNDGNSAAWDQQWDKAIAAYGRALDEFPDDSSVMSSLGLALLAKNRHDEALMVYRRAAQLNPEDPLPIEKCAEILERMGKLHDASQAYYIAAEAFVNKRDVNKAIENWSRATQLEANHLQAYSRLALAYERVGRTAESSAAYVNVSRILQKQGELQKALQSAQRAAQLDSNNPDALSAIDLIQRGISLPEPERPRIGTGTLRPPSQAFSPLDTAIKEPEKRKEEKKSNPLEDARQTALAQLADALFDISSDERAPSPPPSGKGGLGVLKKVRADPFRNVKGGSRAQILSYLTQAIDLQSKGDASTALSFFEKTLRAGMEHAALNFIIGAAYFGMERYKEAAKQFQASSQHPDFAAGAFYGLGVCRGRENKMKDAASYLLRCLQVVDQGTVPESQADMLAASYESLQENLGRDQTEEEMIQIGETLVAFVSGHDWRKRAQDARHQLDAQQEDSTLASLAEMISIPRADRVMESMARIDKHMAKGLWMPALDEAQYAVEYSPMYLPVHIKMAEILAAQNRVEAALAKYTVAAEAYRVRGESARAVRLYQQMAQLAPMDLNIHTKLSQMLTAQGRTAEAIRQNVEIAGIHLSLADFETARQTYSSALLLAQKPGIDKSLAIEILHRIGDLDMQRLDLRQAMKTYEQIKTQNPSDGKARLALIDIYFRLGQARQAIAETDDMLKHLLPTEGLAKSISLMETLIAERGDEPALRQRLARLYQQAGRKADAIAQLDALADLHHQAGNKADAAKTIQAIIALGPDNVAEYQQLLAQLQSPA